MRVTAKYHGIKLEYQEQRHTVLELLARIRPKLRSWRRPYVSQESVRVLLQEWHVGQPLATPIRHAQFYPSHALNIQTMADQVQAACPVWISIIINYIISINTVHLILYIEWTSTKILCCQCMINMGDRLISR